MFADTEKGAEASADVFSIIETAKMNDLDVFGYLNFLLTELPKLGEAPTDEQLACVLPWGEALPDYCRNQSKNKIQINMPHALNFAWGSNH
ncbi:transposase domain-containing protein [Ruminococcus sp. HUN007]|uniref:transposase domain-containing protein n=1 Tax=Ruminococcus sp. HUN007 TaxID=1514668 RepID=UPI000AA89F95|nr:transposase domain-containing protein [Ruminococcus sp. HUN007]